ncbi:Coiled-coil domain-containing protein [Halotydeus destructor]|nr:Coiled-coil domain-containing protein [Halotydeus destructor]
MANTGEEELIGTSETDKATISVNTDHGSQLVSSSVGNSSPVEIFEDVSLSDKVSEREVNDTAESKDALIDDTVDQNGSTFRPLSALSAASNEMSKNSTPLATPLSGSREHLELPDDQRLLLKDMQDQNGLIFGVKALEVKFEAKLSELQSDKLKLVMQLDELTQKLMSQQETFDRTVIEVKNSLTAKLETATKQASSSKKDLESMVVKYAMSEQQVITAKRAKEEAEKRMRDALRDKDALNARVRGLCNDKASLTTSFEKKVSENATLIKDLERMKREMLDRDDKWKRAQSELKTECEHHLETQKQLHEALSELSKIRNEISDLKVKVNQDLGETVNENGESEFVPLSEKLKSEIEVYKSKWTKLVEEHHDLVSRHQDLERSKVSDESTIADLEQRISSMQLELVDYKERLSVIDKLELGLDAARKNVVELETDLKIVKDKLSESETEVTLCRQREGELLEYAERETLRAVSLSKELEALEDKCSSLQKSSDETEAQFDVLKSQREEVAIKLVQANHDIEELKAEREKLAQERDAFVSEFRRRVDELENENRIMRKKHLSSVKELKKELSSFRRTLDLEANSATNGSNADALSIGSRSNSSTSLDVANQQQTPVSHHTSSSNSSSAANGNLANQHTIPSFKLNALPELDKQMLVERILKLQKNLTQKNEKIDFLEEHNHQLVEEMKKKTKLLQNLMKETGDDT